MPLTSLVASVKKTAVFAVLALSGCGGNNGPERYAVSGAALYAGKPIPAGVVYFNPNSANGSQGPQGFALINAGRFDTRLHGGKGSTGGPQQIRVMGFDGQTGIDESPYGARLFPAFVFEKDLPKASTTLDIDVPKSR